jgi:simple sugar transport system ATP-binding protein
MQVAAGEVVALAGDNGAGKTTLIKAISGVYRPDLGRGAAARRAGDFSRRRRRGKGIETIYQDLALADNLTIGANIFLGREPMTARLRLPAGAGPQEDGRGREAPRWRCWIST